VVTAILAVAKTQAISEGVQKLGDNIAGLFGAGAEDKKRRAEIEALFRRAVGGEGVAFRQLEFHAFEKRTGQPGDLRPVPRDRSASPPASREAAKKALRQLIAAQGKALSKPEYYAKLGVTAPQNVFQQVVSAAAGSVADAARPVVRAEVTSTVQDSIRAALPWVIGVLVVVMLGAFLIGRAARAR
jgi:hypothetical protein